MGKAQSKCCGRRKRVTLNEETGDTPEIVPVEEVPVEENGKAKQPEEQANSKPEVETKPEAQPIETQTQSPTEQLQEKSESSDEKMKPDTTETADSQPQSPASGGTSSPVPSPDDVTVRTVVTEKVIDEPKSIPVIIDTAQATDTTKLLESNETQSESYSGSESHFKESTATSRVVKTTVVTERYTLDASSDGGPTNAITTTETVTEKITTEEDEVINKAEEKET
ncbi:uncharacterized protein LOC100373062 [Saccoglossus kowalevskii]|uniref:Flocculation protein FLO11-like n=1 Tax=Saccoglossus kowalevskii TaxID=10224 RepID=A0ABM0GP53_SACKO|nr:PREDICTED: flocculation protein FLO11-like [Saccoglossus kowalevskii]